MIGIGWPPRLITRADDLNVAAQGGDMNCLQLPPFTHLWVIGDLRGGQHWPGGHTGSDQFRLPRGGGGVGRQMRLQKFPQHRLIAHPVIAFGETPVGL